MGAEPSTRLGHGYDLHRLELGRPMVVCGVRFEDAERGSVGHSDGDVGYHALTDAILGALGEDDLGTIFPNTDPQWRDADSSVFLREAVRRMIHARFEICNVDLTIICEQPKMAPVRAELIANVAELLGCDEARVNVKGKTHEGVDAVGEGRAIEAHAVALLEKS